MLSRLLLPACAVILLNACASSTSPLASNAKVTDHGDVGATEGPAYHDGYLYFTDGGPINRMNWATGKAGTFILRTGESNGLMFDPQGRLIACESSNRRVVRYEKNGHKTILAEWFHGKRFNSPNDVTMDSQGRIYFTDPRYGPIRRDMEIHDASGRSLEGVYRIDAPGQVSLVLSHDSAERPNGILISPHDQYLYICDNNNNNHGGSRKLLRFAMNKDGTVQTNTRTVIFDWKNGRGPDGMKMDRAGRLYVAAGVNEKNEYEVNDFKAGCYILSPSGKLITFIPTGPDECCNCAFAGDDAKTLCITSGKHLWTVPVNTAGWQAGTKTP